MIDVHGVMTGVQQRGERAATGRRRRQLARGIGQRQLVLVDDRGSMVKRRETSARSSADIEERAATASGAI
jgi:hypothetical protein